MFPRPMSVRRLDVGGETGVVLAAIVAVGVAVVVPVVGGIVAGAVMLEW